jgi:hypothetical protein
MDAVLAALVAALGAAAVGSGVAPSPVPATQMYAVLYMDPGQSLRESLADQRTDFATSFQVTSVGPTVEKCLWVADKVRVALFPRLTIAGRTAWRAEELGGPYVQRDDDVTPPLYFLPVQYRLQSTS